MSTARPELYMEVSMKYEVEKVDRIIKSRPRPWRYEQIIDLEVGQGFKIPFTELSLDALDPTQTVRSSASHYSKLLGRRFRTKRHANGSITLYRVE